MAERLAGIRAAGIATMAEADLVWPFPAEVTHHEGEAPADGVGLALGGDIETLD